MGQYTKHFLTDNQNFHKKCLHLTFYIKIMQAFLYKISHVTNCLSINSPSAWLLDRYSAPLGNRHFQSHPAQLTASRQANNNNIAMSSTDVGANNDNPEETEDLAEGEAAEQEEEKEPFVSIFEILDAPRFLPEPVEITTSILKEINTELGIITLCWPVLKDVEFENRTAFPKSYLENTDKEKLLLLYAENFRRQFQHKFPDRKQLFLASDNSCGLQVRQFAYWTTLLQKHLGLG